jgi:hypothetical protein
LPVDPETGEVIPQPWPFDENLSVVDTEPVVQPEADSLGGEHVNNEDTDVDNGV